MSLNLRLHAKAVFPGRKLPMRPKKAGQIERVAEAQLFGDGLDAFIGLKQPPGDLLRQNLIHVSAQRRAELPAKAFGQRTFRKGELPGDLCDGQRRAKLLLYRAKNRLQKGGGLMKQRFFKSAGGDAAGHVCFDPASHPHFWQIAAGKIIRR